MAIAFAAPRHARIAVLLLAFSLLASVRAEDAPQPQPAATPSGQKSGGPGGRGTGTPGSPAAAEQHRLPPASTPTQTLRLRGRTLNSPPPGGSPPLFDKRGEPKADIAYTAYQLDGADA